MNILYLNIELCSFTLHILCGIYVWFEELLYTIGVFWNPLIGLSTWNLGLPHIFTTWKYCTTIYLSRFLELSVLANALHGKTTQSCPRWGIELQAILLHGQLVLHGIKHMNIHNTWHGLSHYWMIKSYMHMKDDTICFSLWWLRRKSWLTVPSLV